MSLFTIKCPWCGVTYSTGVVGSQQIGFHRCGGHEDCSSPNCSKEGDVLVLRKGEKTFSCMAHLKSSDIVAAMKPSAGDDD